MSSRWCVNLLVCYVIERVIKREKVQMKSPKKFNNILWKLDYKYENKCNLINSVTSLWYGFEKHMCLFENLAWQIIVNGFAFQHSFLLSFLPKDQCFERFDAQLTFLKWRALISAFCRLIFLLNASFPYRNLIWGGQNIYVHTLNKLNKLSGACAIFCVKLSN